MLLAEKGLAFPTEIPKGIGAAPGGEEGEGASGLFRGQDVPSLTTSSTGMHCLPFRSPGVCAFSGR